MHIYKWYDILILNTYIYIVETWFAMLVICMIDGICKLRTKMLVSFLKMHIAWEGILFRLQLRLDVNWSWMCPICIILCVFYMSVHFDCLPCRNKAFFFNHLILIKKTVWLLHDQELLCLDIFLFTGGMLKVHHCMRACWVGMIMILFHRYMKSLIVIHFFFFFAAVYVQV